jgi:hypothetical protein
VSKHTIKKCASCGHACIREPDDSMWPSEGTPLEKIHPVISDEPRFSLYCTNPECNCYTIYCKTQEEVDRVIERYSKK